MTSWPHTSSWFLNHLIYRLCALNTNLSHSTLLSTTPLFFRERRRLPQHFPSPRAHQNTPQTCLASSIPSEINLWGFGPRDQQISITSPPGSLFLHYQNGLDHATLGVGFPNSLRPPTQLSSFVSDLTIFSGGVQSRFANTDADQNSSKTHVLPRSCGCSTVSGYYPTAALSSLAYSGKTAYSLGAGPGCGRCFKITLVSAHEASPPFVLANRPDLPTPSVVVKIVDKCPSPTYCSATERTQNSVIAFLLVMS